MSADRILSLILGLVGLVTLWVLVGVGYRRRLPGRRDGLVTVVAATVLYAAVVGCGLLLRGAR